MPIRGELKRAMLVPLGEYPAVLTSVDIGPEGEHGATWAWTFSISAGEFADVELSGLSSQTFSTYPSKAFRWASALGHPAEADFNSDLVINHQCRLKVDVIIKPDGGQRNRIMDVLPPTKAQV